ncbi:F-box/kelch-repeat protein At3g23880-like [Silene latifolia]|uniref:F-box/kelch-repeat protein At3g23880-like n=1 Tax=Silene latifolia TaxID=37657 RepID=UPI003D76D277
MSDLNPCFSEDIWFEIFKQLPVKTLGKCRCVCKSWRSLIVSPSFMAAHLKHYTRNVANSLILCKELSRGSERRLLFEQCIFFRDLVQLKSGNKIHTSICPFGLTNQLFPSFHFGGSVNGLLCFSDLSDSCQKHRILLWNPLIQKSIKLSQSTLTSKYSALGFGYDYRRNDHRVVKISLSGRGTPLVEVYSVQERTWRIISTRYLVDNSINWVSSSHCFLNGVIHWCSSQPMGLLLFNVSEETFMKMKLPEKLVKSCRADLIDFGLFEYQGKLSVSLCRKKPTSFNININSANFHIWVKRDYNVESSWCKIISVEYPKLHGFCHAGPIEYLGEDEELIGFGNPGSGQLVSYDPKTEEITKLGLCYSYSSKFSAYSEGLVLLDQKIDDLTADELERYSCQFA